MFSEDELAEQATLNRTFRTTGWLADPEEWHATTILDVQLLPTQNIQIESRLGLTAELSPSENREEEGPRLSLYKPRPPLSSPKPRTAVGSFRGQTCLLPLRRTRGSPSQPSPRRALRTRQKDEGAKKSPDGNGARSGKRETPLGHIAMGHNGMMDLGKGKKPTKLAMGDGRCAAL